MVAPLRPILRLTDGGIVTQLYRMMGGAPKPLVRRAFQLSSFNKLVTKPIAIAAKLDDADFLAQVEAVEGPGGHPVRVRLGRVLGVDAAEVAVERRRVVERGIDPVEDIFRHVSPVGVRLWARGPRGPVGRGAPVPVRTAAGAYVATPFMPREANISCSCSLIIMSWAEIDTPMDMMTQNFSEKL